MRRVRPIGFEALEGRLLLSSAHVGAHPRGAGPAIVLNGTLTVDARSASTTQNAAGGMTTTMTVAGQLSTMGAVRGIWTESTDSLGNYDGPDTLRLHGSKGDVVLLFYNQNNGRPQPTGPDTGEFLHHQKLGAGSGAYAHASESGLIAVNTNASGSRVESLTLSSTPP